MNYFEIHVSSLLGIGIIFHKHTYINVSHVSSVTKCRFLLIK